MTTHNDNKPDDITITTDDGDIRLESGVWLEAYHGTVHPRGQWIRKFDPRRPEPAIRNSRGLVRAGDECAALCELPSIYLTQDGAAALGYATDGDDTWRRREGEGFLYEVEVYPRLVAFLYETTDATVRAAVAAGADCLLPDGRSEIIVLDPDIIDITRITDAEGADVIGWC